MPRMIKTCRFAWATRMTQGGKLGSRKLPEYYLFGFYGTTLRNMMIVSNTKQQLFEQKKQQMSKSKNKTI